MGDKNLARFSLVFLAAAVAVAVFAGHAHGTDVCEKAEDIPFCQSIVKGATDPAAALKAAIEKLIIETKRAEAVDTAMGLGSPEGCKQKFTHAVAELQRSLEFLQAKDKGSLDQCLSSALADYTKCDGAIVEGDVEAQNMGGFRTDNTLLGLASNVFYLATLPWVKVPHH